MRRVVNQERKKRQVHDEVSQRSQMQRNRYRVDGEKQGVDSGDKVKHVKVIHNEDGVGGQARVTRVDEE